MKGVFLVAVTLAALVPGSASAEAAAPAVELTIADAGGASSVRTTTAADGTYRPKSSAALGCRTVDVARVGRDIFGFVVYKFHQRKRWCWDYPRITSKSISAYVTHVDPNME